MQSTRKLAIVAAIASLSAIAAAPAMAGPDFYRNGYNGSAIDHRQAEQQQRIQQGVASGRLTGREAANLQRDQGRIAGMESRARADGRISRNEAERIARAQHNESRDIRRDMHDRQHDYNHDGRNDRRGGNQAWNNGHGDDHRGGSFRPAGYHGGGDYRYYR